MGLAAETSIDFLLDFAFVEGAELAMAVTVWPLAVGVMADGGEVEAVVPGTSGVSLLAAEALGASTEALGVEIAAVVLGVGACSLVSVALRVGAGSLVSVVAEVSAVGVFDFFAFFGVVGPRSPSEGAPRAEKKPPPEVDLGLVALGLLLAVELDVERFRGGGTSRFSLTLCL